MKSIVEKAKAAGDFVCGDDGFYVYWPKGYGALTEQDLYQLHRALIKMNAKWEDELDEYFRLSNDPIQSAKWMVDKHVVKMILETAQLLSTAHRVLDGTQYVDKSKTGRNVKRWRLPDERDQRLYSATHINHPSAVWCRASNNNYNWLYCHFLALLAEYTHRYGKHHKCEDMKDWLMSPPRNIEVGYLTPVTPAMPDEYKVPHNSPESYRNYYRVAKARMHKWTNREVPEWIANTSTP